MAYYPFIGNANDVTGNGHDGTIHGVVLTTDRFGNPNSAYSFNGISDYISVAYSDAFQLPSFTLSVWICPNVDLASLSRHAAIVTRGEDFITDRASFGLSVLDSGSSWGHGVSVHYEDNSDGDYYFDTDYYPQVNSWTHLAATRNSNGQLDIYSNGQLIQTWGSTPQLATNCFQDLIIGAYWFRPSATEAYLANFFPGSIDDVRLYDRVLSLGEIEELAIVPIPSAVLLGSIGLSLAGWKLRKRKEL